MYQVLVNKENGTVLQFIKGSQDERFEIHSNFMWVEWLGEVGAGQDIADFTYNLALQQIQKIEHSTPAYDLARRVEYPDIAEQFDKLWHDMEQGVVPGKDGQWYQSVAAVKDKYPKS